MQPIGKRLLVTLVLVSVALAPLTWLSVRAETTDGSDDVIIEREGPSFEKHNVGEPDVGDTGRQVQNTQVQTWPPDLRISWWQRVHWSGGFPAPYVWWIPFGAD